MEKTNREWRDILMGWVRKAEALALVEPATRFSYSIYGSGSSYLSMRFEIQDVEFVLDDEVKGTEDVFNAVNATMEAIAISCKTKLANKRAELEEKIAALDEAASTLNEE